MDMRPGILDSPPGRNFVPDGAGPPLNPGGPVFFTAWQLTWDFNRQAARLTVYVFRRTCRGGGSVFGRTRSPRKQRGTLRARAGPIERSHAIAARLGQARPLLLCHPLCLIRYLLDSGACGLDQLSGSRNASTACGGERQPLFKIGPATR